MKKPERSIYYANASIVKKEHKQYATSREIKFHWVWNDEVGQMRRECVWRVNNRPAEYFKSIHDADPDANWAQHHKTVEMYYAMRGRQPMIGKARPLGQMNARGYFSSAILTYDKSNDIYDFVTFMGQPDSDEVYTTKFCLTPQNNKLYPYKGEYRSGETAVTKGVMLW